MGETNDTGALANIPIPFHQECDTSFRRGVYFLYWPRELLTVGEPVFLWNDLCITPKFDRSLSRVCKNERKVKCLFFLSQVPILLSKTTVDVANF